jgi:hypothetical protein
MNFLRILSGTRYAAFVPTRPKVRAGLLLKDNVGSTGGTIVPCEATGASSGGAIGRLFGGTTGSLKGKINTHHAGRSDGKEKTNVEIYRPPGGDRGDRRLKYKELSYQVGQKEEWAVSRGCVNVVGTTMLAKGTT